jgi:hypothetical protein
MVAHLDALINDDRALMLAHPPAELDRYELRRLHEEAVLVARMYREFFPNVRRPSQCPIDARPAAKPGTLAGLMQEGR